MVGVFNCCMSDYTEITFRDISTEQAAWLIAELSEIGFEGFEEMESVLKAFIPADSYNEIALKEITVKLSVGFSKNIIEETNWNEVWESNFQPLIINDFVAIRAVFHQPIEGAQHEIIITPKMSFGTGHHATTYMMILRMREIDFNGKTVFDFGTGTGVLAILAEKSGAAKIIAIDNDDWSIANAAENIQQNDCHHIQLLKTSSPGMNRQFDIILANINKNVILDHFSILIKQLAPGGILLLSGLLDGDETAIFQAANQHNMKITKDLSQNNWICLSVTSIT
jgi:ribosomal protein L11 methyltransferase